jgi:NADH-quinone oxidoreductase subunit J
MQNIDKIQPIIFYVFATLAIFAASMVVISKNSVRAVLFLVLTFFATAGLWMLLHAEFLAVTLVLVYVGAVMVLFLFVVMMLDVESASFREGFARFLPLGLSVAALVVFGLVFAVGARQFGIEIVPAPVADAVNFSNVEQLGILLYTEFLYPLELAGVLLLVAIIAAISLTFRGRRGTIAPNPTDQLKIRKEDRVKLFSFSRETGEGARRADEGGV